jgi:hypothetical protein
MTGRCGKIDQIHAQGDLGKEQIPTAWRVLFSDGKSPLIQYFNNGSELSLVSCPHSESDPGFVPDRGIID